MPKIPEKSSQVVDTLALTEERFSGKGVFFNEINLYAAKWLGNLFVDSNVETASIADVMPAQLQGYKRVHFFAGLGGWEYALRLAGWPDDEEVWTGSCPCQPFSVAGKQKGESDERHLWPEMRRLIGECLPTTIFGEQVAGELGLEWLDGVCTDLEALGYAVAAAVLPAAGVGAPHRRDRIYWVADAKGTGGEKGRNTRGSGERTQGELRRSSLSCSLGDTDSNECDNTDERTVRETSDERNDTQCSDGGRTAELARTCIDKPWDRYQWIDCSDGKRRRIPSAEQGILPLATRVPCTVEQISAYGNAIVPQVAAVFIKSFLEARDGR